MGASSEKQKRSKHGKQVGRFIVLPYALLESVQYRALSYSARALLTDFIRQYNGRNNGKLVLCSKAMKPLGWDSNATLTKATSDLVKSGLIIMTRQGYRPNVASWYSMAWKALDVTEGLDINYKQYRQVNLINAVEQPSIKKAQQ